MDAHVNECPDENHNTESVRCKFNNLSGSKIGDAKKHCLPEAVLAKQTVGAMEKNTDSATAAQDDEDVGDLCNMFFPSYFDSELDSPGDIVRSAFGDTLAVSASASVSGLVSGLVSVENLAAARSVANDISPHGRGSRGNDPGGNLEHVQFLKRRKQAISRWNQAVSMWKQVQHRTS